MSKTYELECNGSRVIVERLPSDEIVFHHYDVETDIAMEALGDDPSPCLTLWRAIQSDGDGLDVAMFKRVAAMDHEAVKLLLFAGANPRDRDSGAFHDIFEGIYHTTDDEELEMIDILIDAGTDIDVSEGFPLNTAIMRGNTPLAKYLIDKGADMELSAALNQALHRGNEEVAQYLIDKGADVEFEDNAAITIAATYGMTDIVESLISAGAGRNSSLEDALTAAAENGHADIVERLIDAGAYVPSIGNNALDRAITEGHRAVVILLLENGVQLPDGAPEEAMYAYDHGNYEYAADVLIG